jgi:glucan 1,3-beta-glucosidase
VPSDPRTAVGTCATLDIVGDQFNGSYSSWATGGAGANSFTPGETQAYPWPPVTLNNVPDGAAVTQLPSYVETGSIVTLPTPTLTGVPASVSQGDGWYDSSDTTAGVTAIQGCSYPDAWSAVSVLVSFIFASHFR